MDESKHLVGEHVLSNPSPLAAHKHSNRSTAATPAFPRFLTVFRIGSGYPQALRGCPYGSFGYPYGLFGYPQGVFGCPRGSCGYPYAPFGYPHTAYGVPIHLKLSSLYAEFCTETRVCSPGGGFLRVWIIFPRSSRRDAARYRHQLQNRSRSPLPSTALPGAAVRSAARCDVLCCAVMRCNMREM